EDRRRVESALMNRVKDAGEYLLGLGPASGAIPAADLAGHDGGPERVFGAPVRGIDGVGFKEKREDGRKLDGEMRGEIAGDASGARRMDERVELMVEMTTRDREAMGRDGATLIAIADRERVLQDPLDARREVVLAVVGDQGATPPEQMGQTRLMNRMLEPP